MKRMHGLLVVLVVIFISASPIFADPGYTFWPGRVDIPITNAPLGFSKADFNNDHYDDFVIFNNSPNLVLLLGGPNGFVKTNFPLTSNRPSSFCTGDFNNDSNADIVYADAFSPVLYTLLGNGQGGFTPAGSMPVTNNENIVQCVDIDRDGNVDLVTEIYGNSTFRVRFGAGNGTFPTTASFNLPTPPAKVAVNDFNRDGFKDLAFGVSNTTSQAVYVFINNRAGGFGAPIAVNTGISSPFDLTSSDYNCDGVMDIAAIGQFGGQFGGMAVMLGNGAGGFLAPVVYNVPFTLAGISSEDATGDGMTDLVVFSRDSSVLAVYANNWNGQFTSTFSSSIPTDTQSFYLIDMNRDMNKDICFFARASFGTGILSCSLGNGLGKFQISQNFGMTQGNAPISILSSDWNQDGKKDLVEISRVNNTTANTVVKTYFGNGLGGFIPVFNSSLNSSTGKAVLKDLNGDGYADLILLSWTALNIYYGGNTGTFSNLTSYAVPGGTSSAITVGDFTGDQIIDILIADQNFNKYLFIGNTQGTYTMTVINSIFGLSREFVSADFNGDGRLDLISFRSSTGDIYLGTGTGNFNPFNSITYSNMSSVIVLDVNNDQRPDILYAYSDYTKFPVGRLGVFLGVGNGTFTRQPTDYPIAGEEIAGADYNSDGNWDVISKGDSVAVSYGNGLGNFSSESTWLSPDFGWVSSFTLDDFNGDGKVDVGIGGALLPNTTSNAAGLSMLFNNLSNVYINLSGNKKLIAPGERTLIKVKVQNRTNQSQTFTATAVTVLPNQTVRTDFVVPGIPIAANQTFEVDIPYFVPAGSALGDYTFKINIGTSASNIWDAGTFDFKVGYPIYCPVM